MILIFSALRNFFDTLVKLRLGRSARDAEACKRHPFAGFVVGQQIANTLRADFLDPAAHLRLAEAVMLERVGMLGRDNQQNLAVAVKFRMAASGERGAERACQKPPAA